MAFAPDEIVSAEYDEGQWYLASVEQSLGDGNYLVSWLDGDTANRLRHALELRRTRFNRESQAYEVVEERETPAASAAPLSMAPAEDEGVDEGGQEEMIAMLEPGDRVEVVGLPDVEPGLRGTVVEQAGEEWIVAVDGYGEQLLPPQHLQIVPPDEGSEQGEGEGEMEMEGMEEPGLEPGLVVQVLKGGRKPELGGLLGSLLESREEGRWMVQLEGREEPVEMGLEELVRVGAEEDVYEKPWEADFEPPPFYVFGSWGGGQGAQLMNWDPARSCFQYLLELGDGGEAESFRILVDGDLDQQLHPDHEAADIHTGFQVQGPGKNDNDCSWAVGRHALDEAAPGARYELRLCIGRAGFYKVDWARLGKYEFGKRTKPVEQKTAAEALAARLPALAPNRATLKIILQAARPKWSGPTLESVIEKLVRVEVESGVALIEALARNGGEELNGRLRAAGEKAFSRETLEAIRERAAAWENEVRMREHVPVVQQLDIQVFKLDDRPSDGMAVMDPTSLPVQTFKVVSWKTVFVRERPCANSPAIGVKMLHEEVKAKEQSFDGYVKLLGEPGWILRDTGDEQGLGRILEVVEGEHPYELLLEEFAPFSGPQKFVVTHQGRGVIRVMPDDASPAIAFKHVGENVYIETQTYNGWLRVSADEPSNGGWMLASDPEDGQLLRCQHLEERQRKARGLRQAREVLSVMNDLAPEEAPDTSKLRAGLALAKEVGMDREELKNFERLFEELQKREEREREQQKRLQAKQDLQMLLVTKGVDAKTMQVGISRAKATAEPKKKDEELQAIVKEAELRLQQLKKDEEEERKQKARKMHMQHRIQTSAGNVRLLKGCLHDAQEAALEEEVDMAEKMLQQAIDEEREQLRKSLVARIQTAQGKEKEKELAACKSEAAAAGFKDVVAMAEEAGVLAAEESKSTAATHETLLAAVTAAAGSQDKEEIKRAREAAKKAGIPIKLIAKAYAMGTEN